ncbi:Thiamine repressible genes regulatory protein thi1 like [Verticillium longisporum]|uniref:Thiamine repressible genes regulatory protein thi1 like n=1 Tax=Verticillium longisporum TaxID=100787 RepID=A0A8I2ZN68_VERLO|nr:Thiamine repressible genes regulatory protein thi1 like [Verticillium longisporum]
MAAVEDDEPNSNSAGEDFVSSRPAKKRRHDTALNEAADPDGPACQSCRRKKAKCTRRQPCSACVRYNVECLYDDRKNKPGLRTGAVENLSQRVATLESMFLGQGVLWQQVFNQLSSLTSQEDSSPGRSSKDSGLERMADAAERPRLRNIFQAIVSTCARFSDDARLGSPETKAQMTKRYRQAVIVESMESFSVENLQALIICAFDTIGSGRAARPEGEAQDSIGGFAYCIEATESLSLVTSFFLQQAVDVTKPQEVQMWLLKFKQLDLRLVQWKIFLPEQWREACALNCDGHGMLDLSHSVYFDETKPEGDPTPDVRTAMPNMSHSMVIGQPNMENQDGFGPYQAINDYDQDASPDRKQRPHRGGIASSRKRTSNEPSI